MKILKHPIFEPCTCDKCMTVFQVDTNDELNTVFYDGVIQAWKIDCPVCRHRCNLEWAGIINPSDVTDTKDKAEVARKIFEEIEEYAELQIESLNIAEKVDLSGAAFFGGGKQAFVILLDRLAELKKKYTQSEPPKGD